MLISAALLQGPRPPASERAFTRTYRAVTAGKTTVCNAALSGKPASAIRVVQVVPFSELRIW
jgi:hypothetical protein